MGFEPTRAEPIGLAVQRLNHSATSSLLARDQKKEMFSHDKNWDISDDRPSELEKIASAGNRTRINCLEGSYADHYTTDAFPPSIDKTWKDI